MDKNSLASAPQPAAAGIQPLVAGDVAAARRFVVEAKAANTRRAYESDWKVYLAWCAARGFAPAPCPPAQAALFLAAQAEAGLKPKTLGRRLSAIGHFCRAAGHPAPSAMEGALVIEETLAGIRRVMGVRPRKKRPAVAELVEAMIAATDPSSMIGKRDRAILALGLASAMRRSELVVIDVAHIARRPGGVEILIPRSKGDQEGAGQIVAVPHGKTIRPVVLLDAWLEAAGIVEGPVFRRISKSGHVLPNRLSAEYVADIVKRRAAAIGLDPAEFAAHSLRSGFLTSAAERGANPFRMRDVSRHAELDTLLGYVEAADRFKDHAGSGFL